MRYGSLFSGVEAASLAFEPLGWRPTWFAEIEPFCCKVLNHHWSGVPNLGNVTSEDFFTRASKVDLIIGGSPCPSFSVAGGRKGMGDPRGVLTLRYCEIVNTLRPKWFIWENVPGVLTSNDGEDFEVVINEMVKSGYGVCWRVLDARCFGLPQSRKRLYVVGRIGERCPPEVLFEQEDCCNTPKKHGKKQQRDASTNKGLDVIPICLRGRAGMVMEFMSYFGCLRASPGFARNFVWDGACVRVLTPLEYERLQGIPDDHTNISGARDADRWKALGNSMAVPVIRWIGQRIRAVETSGQEVYENQST